MSIKAKAIAIAVAAAMPAAAMAEYDNTYDSSTQHYTINEDEATSVDSVNFADEAAARANPVSVITVSGIKWRPGSAWTVFGYLTSGTSGGQIAVLASSGIAVRGVSSLSVGDSAYLFKVQHLLDGNTLLLSGTEAPYTIGTALTGRGTLAIDTTTTNSDGTANDAAVKFTVATTQASGSGGSSSSGASGSSSGSSSSSDTGSSSSSSSDSGSDSGSDSSSSSSAASGQVDEASLRLTAHPQTYGVVLAQNAATLLLAHGTMNALSGLSALSSSRDEGFQPFLSVYGGAVHNEGSGSSHVSLSDLEVAAGLGWKGAIQDKGTLSAAGFVESGFGTFKNHYSAGPAEGHVDKKGHGHYAGVGATIEYWSESLWHADAVVRGGSQTTTSNNSLYNAALDATGSYEIKSGYFGAELGFGKAFDLSKNSRLDLYGRYIYLHQEGDSFSVFGDRYKLSDVNTHIIRAGLKETFTL
ncbi:MAG: autotransporter outer membrane beta-barrel domain-containing protein, partial [Succinivibrio sp.]